MESTKSWCSCAMWICILSGIPTTNGFCGFASCYVPCWDSLESPSICVRITRNRVQHLRWVCNREIRDPQPMGFGHFPSSRFFFHWEVYLVPKLARRSPIPVKRFELVRHFFEKDSCAPGLPRVADSRPILVLALMSSFAWRRE